MKTIVRSAAALLAVIFSLGPLTVVSQTVAPPAGFVRVELPAGAQTLVSTPFVPFDDSIDAVLSGQLIGSTNENIGDKIFKWDAAKAQYVSATKVDGTGKAEIDGKWFSDLASRTPSDMTIEPGEGFFIQNRQDFVNVIYLSGEVPLEPTNSATLLPSLNLVGYPYSTPIALPDASLLGSDVLLSGDQLIDPTGELSATNLLRMGKGYWYRRNSVKARTWDETRPYPTLFGGRTAPSIASVTPVDDGMEVMIGISCSGVKRVDVFYQDLSQDGRFDPAKNWKLAVLYGVQTSGGNTIQWTDWGDIDRQPVSQVLGRAYLVADADIDSDGDGVSDAREQFVYGTDPKVNESAAGNVATPPPASTNNASLSQEPSVPRRTLYVDQNAEAIHWS